MTSGYESIYLGLIPRLADCDFQESAERLGLDYVDGTVRVRFLNRDYRITREGVEPLDGRPVHVNNRSVLLYYLLSKGQGDPGDDYILFENLPRMLSGLNLQTRVLQTPLEQYFGNDYLKFREAAMKLDGREEESQVGKHRWRFRVLPKIPLEVVYYEADEEFPVDIQIKLEKTALGFLEFECLAFMVGCFVHALIKATQSAARPAATLRRRKLFGTPERKGMPKP